MKRKAENEKQSLIERFCSASERTARVSLLAAAIVVGTIGTVSVAAIRSNTASIIPSDNVELNAAQDYLAQVSMQAATSDTAETTEETASSDESGADITDETRETKRGGLTGDHVVDVKNLKSLSNEDLVKAIKQGQDDQERPVTEHKTCSPWLDGKCSYAYEEAYTCSYKQAHTYNGSYYSSQL